MKKLLHSIILITSISGATLMTTNSSLAEDQTQTFKITDSKLSPINYGAESIEYWIERMKPDDERRRKSLQNDLAKLKTRFGRITATDDEQYQFVENRLKQIEKQLTEGEEAKSSKETPTAEETDVEKTAGDSKSNISAKPHASLYPARMRLETIEEQLAALGENDSTVKVSNNLQGLLQSFARVPKSSHADYVDVAKRISVLKTAIEKRTPKLEMTEQQVKEFLAKVAAKYGPRGEVQIPRAHQAFENRELTKDGLDEFINQARAFGENADEDIKTLRPIFLATGEGKYWVEYLGTTTPEYLAKEVANVAKEIDSIVRIGMANAKGRSEKDPAVDGYSFSENYVKRATEEHNRIIGTLEQAARFAESFEIENKWKEQKIAYEKISEVYFAKAGKVADLTELPTEIGTKEMRKTAEEVLKTKKYGITGWERLIVNSKNVPRDRIEHKEFNGKLETIIRKWEEFQVTTVEKVDGKYFLYHNVLAKFSRAPRTTPIGEWILAKRFKGREISADKLK